MTISFAGLLFAQDAPNQTAPNPNAAKKNLVLNGKTLSAAIVQIDGRSYVDVQTLVENTNGSVSFETERVVMTIPTTAITAAGVTDSTAPGAAEAIPIASPQDSQMLSKGFASAANATLENIKEWQGALGTMVTYGLAAGGGWAQGYHDRVLVSLTQTTTLVTTDADHAVLTMLNAEVDNLEKWASTVLAERQALNAARTVDPNSLQNDPVLGKISACGNFLGNMIVTGIYSDNPSCH